MPHSLPAFCLVVPVGVTWPLLRAWAVTEGGREGAGWLCDRPRYWPRRSEMLICFTDAMARYLAAGDTPAWLLRILAVLYGSLAGSGASTCEENECILFSSKRGFHILRVLSLSFLSFFKFSFSFFKHTNLGI